MGKLLEKKICVVTGASRGIGREIALSYAREGADVIFTYHSNEKAAKDTLNELLKTGSNVCLFKSDAGEEKDVIALADKIKKQFGCIDVLVNNAGTFGNECRTVDLTSEEWDEVMHTDLKGVFLAVKHLIPLFRKNSVGKIINISSELSLKGRANYLAYTAAKGAVNSMTRSLALELAPDILVNTLAPGPIDTDMITEDWVEREKQIPLKRLGKVSEIAGTAVLLASEYGDFYTGQFISPNGGAVFVQ